MPKKVKLTKKEEEQKIEEKSVLTQEEIKSLEQLIKREKQDINETEFKQILKDQKVESSPSLKKINAPQRNPITLERDIITGSMSINNLNKDDEENGFKYIQKNTEKEQPQYIKYGKMIVENIISQRDIIKPQAGNIITPRIEVRFQSSMQDANSMQENFEKYSLIEKFDKNKRTIKNPFERKEVKYTPGKY
jgi:hypothetical protein